MKRLFFLCMLLLIGCSADTTPIHPNEVIEITYYNINLIAEDTDEFINEINTLDFTYKKNIDINAGSPKIIIKQKDSVTVYYVNNEDISVTINDKSYIAPKTEAFSYYLDQLNQKYDNAEFYEIDYVNQYYPTDSNHIIKLDNQNNYIILTILEPIYYFKINEVEVTNGEYIEQSLLYEKNDTIFPQTIYIRKTISQTVDSIKLTFENKYKRKVIIVPHFTSDGSIDYNINK